MLEHPQQLNITQSELTPRVADYFDNLLAQRDAILARYILTPETAEEFCNIHSTDEDRENMLVLYERIMYVIEHKQIPLHLDKQEQYCMAREIMGEEQFIGVEDIEQAFGFKPSDHEIPPIPYSLEQLQQAKELGEYLILRVAQDDQENFMTIERMRQIIRTRFNVEEIFQNRDIEDIERKEFFTAMPLKTEWKLVGQPLQDGWPMPDQIEWPVDYARQTSLLRDYLVKVGTLSQKAAEEINDDVLRSMCDTIEWGSSEIKSLDSDALMEEVEKRSKLKKMVKLSINQVHRRSPVEIVYDYWIQHKTLRHTQPEGIGYEWSSTINQKTGNIVGIQIGEDGYGICFHISEFVPAYKEEYVLIIPQR